MSSWLCKKLNIPYTEGDFYAVTVSVRTDQELVTTGISEEYIGEATGTTSTGIVGKKNALRKGLKILGEYYLRDWRHFQPATEVLLDQFPDVDTSVNGSKPTAPHPRPGVLINGPRIDPRPGSTEASYQIGVLKGFLDLPSHVADFTALNFPASLSHITTMVHPWLGEPGFLTPSAKVILEPGYDPPVKQLEIQYDSFVAFDKIVEELRLSLIEYQKEHESLETQQYVHEGTNAPIDFDLIGEAVAQAVAELKEFLVWNGIDLNNERVAFGWRTDSYPALAYIRLPQKGEPELGQGKLKRTSGDYKISPWHFLWKGFARLEKLDYFNDATVTIMLRQMGSIISKPSLSVRQFVDAYPGAFSALGSKKLWPCGAMELDLKSFDQFATSRIPKTKEQVKMERDLTVDQSLLQAISTRNKTMVGDPVGDSVFTTLPDYIDKIKTLDDVATLLGKVGFNSRSVPSTGYIDKK